MALKLIFEGWILVFRNHIFWAVEFSSRKSFVLFSGYSDSSHFGVGTWAQQCEGFCTRLLVYWIEQAKWFTGTWSHRGSWCIGLWWQWMLILFLYKLLIEVREQMLEASFSHECLKCKLTGFLIRSSLKYNKGHKTKLVWVCGNWGHLPKSHGAGGPSQVHMERKIQSLKGSMNKR